MCFTKGNIKTWFNRFLDKDFKHCFVLTELDGNIYCINKCFGGIDLVFVGDSIEQIVSESDWTAVVAYEVNTANLNKIDYRGFINCLTVVKALLWARCWSITPKQLYKFLLKNGGICLKPYSPWVD